MMGGYFYNEFNGNEGQLTATYGVQAFVAADSSTTGSLISNMVGGHFTAQPQDTGRISTATGVYGVANTATTRVTDVSTMIGGDFEISIDNSAYPITISNIYGVRSVIDINQPFTGSLSALFYGDYQGTLYPSSVYGVYIIDTVDNYFAGKIGIGDATPTNELDVQGSVRIGSGYNSIAAPANGLIVEGNVGIGTTNPLSKLHVNGDIRASLSNVGQANVVAYNTSTGLFTYLATSSISSLPGGSDGQVQYNNGGVFGGASDYFMMIQQVT
jgi:hypothetical protein